MLSKADGASIIIRKKMALLDNPFSIPTTLLPYVVHANISLTFEEHSVAKDSFERKEIDRTDLLLFDAP